MNKIVPRIEIASLAGLPLVLILPIKFGGVFLGTAETQVTAYYVLCLLVIAAAQLAYWRYDGPPCLKRVPHYLVGMCLLGAFMWAWLSGEAGWRMDFSQFHQGGGVVSAIMFGLSFSLGHGLLNLVFGGEVQNLVDAQKAQKSFRP